MLVTRKEVENAKWKLPSRNIPRSRLPNGLRHNVGHYLREWIAAEFLSECMALFCVFDFSIASWRQQQIQWFPGQMVSPQHPNKASQ